MLWSSVNKRQHFQWVSATEALLILLRRQRFIKDAIAKWLHSGVHKSQTVDFFCDYTFNYKNNLKKKTYALSCLKFKSFSVFTNYPSADGNLVQVTQIWDCPIHTI